MKPSATTPAAHKSHLAACILRWVSSHAEGSVLARAPCHARHYKLTWPEYLRRYSIIHQLRGLARVAWCNELGIQSSIYHPHTHTTFWRRWVLSPLAAHWELPQQQRYYFLLCLTGIVDYHRYNADTPLNLHSWSVCASPSLAFNGFTLQVIVRTVKLWSAASCVCGVCVRVCVMVSESVVMFAFGNDAIRVLVSWFRFQSEHRRGETPETAPELISYSYSCRCLSDSLYYSWLEALCTFWGRIRNSSRNLVRGLSQTQSHKDVCVIKLHAFGQVTLVHWPFGITWSRFSFIAERRSTFFLIRVRWVLCWPCPRVWQKCMRPCLQIIICMWPTWLKVYSHPKCS